MEITCYTTRDGLVDDVVYDVMEDDRNNLWLSTTRGIVRISKQEIDRFDSKKGSLQPVTYGTADGLATREGSGGGHPAGCRGGDGKLWFSTLKGAAVIDPNRIKINEHAPPVVIEEVLVDDRSTDNHARLAPGTQRVEFHYAGLSLRPRKRLPISTAWKASTRIGVMAVRRESPPIPTFLPAPTRSG